MTTLTDANFLPALKKIEAIKFKKITSGFNKARNDYKLPRIVFLGQFKFLSLTDQRYLCTTLGFENFHHLVSLNEITHSENKKTGSLLNMWRAITKDFTQLVVIGDASTIAIETDLYKAYKTTKKDQMAVPLIEKYNIPVIMESELIRIHPDYPNINKSTNWKNFVPII